MVEAAASPHPQFQPKSTPSTGRLCSVCNKKFFRDSFSDKQWKLHANKRKCKACIEEQLKNPQPPQPKSTDNSNPKPSESKSKSPLHRHTSPITTTRIIPTRARILDSKGHWFTSRAEAVFTEIFDRFDKDKDSAWTVEEIQSFAEFTNGAKFTAEELKEIKVNLKHNKEGNLTRQGFLDFYHLQTQSHKEETWKDLHRLGYTNKLQKREEPNKQTKHDK